MTAHDLCDWVREDISVSREQIDRGETVALDDDQTGQAR